MDLPALDVLTGNGVSVRHTDSIDLSNACRAIYQSRLESTQKLKEKWKHAEKEQVTYSNGSSEYGNSYIGSRHNGPDDRSTSKTSLSSAINTLRKEMATLLDQDLCLMKQLLTLNEEIEDLKWRRLHLWNPAPSFCSSDMIQSAVSLGRVDEHAALQYPTPSSLSLQLDGPTARLSVYNDDDPCATFNRTHVKSKTIKAIIENSNSNKDKNRTIENIGGSSNKKVDRVCCNSDFSSNHENQSRENAYFKQDCTSSDNRRDERDSNNYRVNITHDI